MYTREELIVEAYTKAEKARVAKYDRVGSNIGFRYGGYTGISQGIKHYGMYGKGTLPDSAVNVVGRTMVGAGLGRIAGRTAGVAAVGLSRLKKKSARMSRLKKKSDRMTRQAHREVKRRERTEGMTREDLIGVILEQVYSNAEKETVNRMGRRGGTFGALSGAGYVGKRGMSAYKFDRKVASQGGPKVKYGSTIGAGLAAGAVASTLGGVVGTAAGRGLGHTTVAGKRLHARLKQRYPLKGKKAMFSLGEAKEMTREDLINEIAPALIAAGKFAAKEVGGSLAVAGAMKAGGKVMNRGKK